MQKFSIIPQKSLTISARTVSSICKKFTSLKFSKRHLATTVLSIGTVFGVIGSTLHPSKAAIVSQKDARVTPSYDWMIRPPLAAVGQLEIQMASGQYATCTFTVVGRNIGLTNTHCLLDEQGRGPLQLKAYAVRYGNRFLALANVDRYWTGMNTAPKTVGERVRDWAIIRFTSNLGDTTGWFGNMIWSPNVNQAGQSVVAHVTNYIGYPGDWPTAAAFKSGDVLGHTPAMHAGCEILGIQFGMLLHNCDTNPGTSGSSLYSAVSDTDLRTMGLNDAHESTTNGTSINLAVPLERFMPAIQELRRTQAANGTIIPRP